MENMLQLELSLKMRYCQVPSSDARVQRFLRFRLKCHDLTIAARRLAGVFIYITEFAHAAVLG